MKHQLQTLFLILFVLFLTKQSYAFRFIPTEYEWTNWPEYCKAKYYSIPASSNSPFRNRVSKANYEKWKAILNPTYKHIHHYCASLSYYSRASGVLDKGKKNGLLDRSLVEAQYTERGITINDPLYAEIVTQIALYQYKLNNTEAAFNKLSDLIVQHPEHPSAYSLLSLIYKNKGEDKKAIEILEQGNKAVNNKSGEIHYFLGLLYFKEEKYEKAKIHAEAANSLGYKLPGLQKKLEKIGKW